MWYWVGVSFDVMLGIVHVARGLPFWKYMKREALNQMSDTILWAGTIHRRYPRVRPTDEHAALRQTYLG